MRGSVNEMRETIGYFLEALEGNGVIAGEERVAMSEYNLSDNSEMTNRVSMHQMSMIGSCCSMALTMLICGG